MMKKLLKLVAQPIYKRIQQPSFRYSGYFMVLQDAFTHLPHEKVIKTAMDFVSYSNLEGDYLEFGVFQGGHFTTAYHFSQMNRLDFMKFYAFDSFEGLPEIAGVDARAPQQFVKGEFHCDAANFKKNISNNGVDLAKVTIVPGWFDQSLTQETKRKLPIRKAAIIWIDCDLYESTVPVLEFITDYVQDGTLLLFDDWFCFHGNPDYGEQRAFREWLQRNQSIRASEFYKYGWTGNSFILHRNPDSPSQQPASRAQCIEFKFNTT